MEVEFDYNYLPRDNFGLVREDFHRLLSSLGEQITGIIEEWAKEKIKTKQKREEIVKLGRIEKALEDIIERLDKLESITQGKKGT